MRPAGCLLRQHQQLGKPSEDTGTVGAAQGQSCKMSKLQTRRCARALSLHGSEGSGPGFRGSPRHLTDTEHLGNSQLFYKTGHSSTLVKLPDDSPEIVVVRKQCSPETPFLDIHDPPLLPRTLAPGTQPELGLGAPPSQQECRPEMEQSALLSLPNLLGNDHNERNEH